VLNHKDPAHQAVFTAQEAMEPQDAMGLVVKQEDRKHLPLLNHKDLADQEVSTAQEIMELPAAMGLVVKQEDHPLVNHKNRKHQVASKFHDKRIQLFFISLRYVICYVTFFNFPLRYRLKLQIFFVTLRFGYKSLHVKVKKKPKIRMGATRRSHPTATSNFFRQSLFKLYFKLLKNIFLTFSELLSQTLVKL
jgi:hypothetical protein